MMLRATESARGDPARVYVPNSAGDSVDVIDPRTYKVVEHFPVGALPLGNSHGRDGRAPVP